MLLLGYLGDHVFERTFFLLGSYNLLLNLLFVLEVARNRALLHVLSRVATFGTVLESHDREDDIVGIFTVGLRGFQAAFSLFLQWFVVEGWLVTQIQWDFVGCALLRVADARLLLATVTRNHLTLV